MGQILQCGFITTCGYSDNGNTADSKPEDESSNLSTHANI